ncbi:MOSC domain-containing protein [Palleronia sp.]|uniref:MOSC domain-containing protein n=1 Tax=Palleronia sp. TaxID=1940284 RepID=UPI0035C831FC
MMARHAQAGRVTWIGLRPARRAGMEAVEAAEISEAGVAGDHGRAGKRAVTLIQAEHLPVIAAMLGCKAVAAEDLRRNIVVAGINLGALRGTEIRVGGARLLIETVCAPCSRMEETFGHGGYNAVRGHGGWCARVVLSGPVALGDDVVPTAG